MQSYRFFARRFGLPPVEREMALGFELKTAAELEVGLPSDNLTILEIARKLASRIKGTPIPSAASERRAWAGEERRVLRETLRFAPVHVEAGVVPFGHKNEGTGLARVSL